MLKSVFYAGLAACLALAGCQTTSIDTQVQKSLPVVCKSASDARPIVDVLIASGKIKGKTATAVQAAYTTLDGLCVDPAHETAASVLASAVAAYLTVSLAMKSGQAS